MIPHGPTVRFGYHLAFDLGASDPHRGSGKTALYDRKWKRLNAAPASDASGEGASGKVCPEGFTGAQSLIRGIGRLMGAHVRRHGAGLSKSDQAAESVVVLVPAQASLKKIVTRFANLRNRKTDQSLTGIDFRKLPAAMKAEGLRLAPDCKLVVTNDMAGGIAAALSQIAGKYPGKFGPGLDMIYMATGGGCGVARAEWQGGRRDGGIRLELTELGNMPDPVDGQSTEIASASLPPLLRNFTDRLPGRLQAHAENFRRALNGKAVTDYETARAMLPGLTEPEFMSASAYSVNRYVDGLANMATVQLLRGGTLAVIAGPIAGGVKAFMDRYPQLFAPEIRYHDENVPHARRDRPPLEKLFLSRIHARVSPTGRQLFANNRFDVLSDIEVPDNTLGAKQLAQATFDHRGDRLMIPARAF